MAHATSRGAYGALSDRLNRFPQGAPPTDLLYRILALLFSEREAGLVAQLPVRPFTARRAARRWGMREAEASTVLDGLASRAILLDIEGPNGTVYILPPPMAGFFEFSMMRVRDDIDQHLLSELFYQYITVEDDFILALFTNGETQLGRVFVNEPALADARPAKSGPAKAGLAARATGDGALHVLDHERASEVIQTARAHGRRHLLLPPQGGARRQGLQGAHGHLHDVRRHGGLAHPPRVRAAGGCRGGHGPAGRGAREPARPVR